MTKRDKIMQAAVNIEGCAVLLPARWNYALVGYRAEGRKAIGVYSMHRALSGVPKYKGGMPYDPEDRLLDDVRETRNKYGLEPLIILTE